MIALTKKVYIYSLSFLFLVGTIIIPTPAHARQLGAADAISGHAPCRVSGSDDLASLRTMGRVTQSAILEAAWPCAKGILMGAWEATGGLVVSAAKCVWSPIKCARKAKTALKNAYDFFSNIGAKVSQAFSALSQMSAADKASIICSIIGGIAGPVLLTILTGGAASGSLGLTLARITTKLTKLASMGRRFASIPISKIAHLSQGHLNKLNNLLRNGKERLVQRLIKQGCK